MPQFIIYCKNDFRSVLGYFQNQGFKISDSDEKNEEFALEHDSEGKLISKLGSIKPYDKIKPYDAGTKFLFQECLPENKREYVPEGEKFTDKAAQILLNISLKLDKKVIYDTNSILPNLRTFKIPGNFLDTRILKFAGDVILKQK